MFENKATPTSPNSYAAKHYISKFSVSLLAGKLPEDKIRYRNNFTQVMLQ